MPDFIRWPPPGSTEAQAKGCTCPVKDNEYGVGVPSPQGDGRSYWVHISCPLHKKTTKEE